VKIIKNFLDAQEALSQFIPSEPSTGPYTLDTIIRLMEYLGNPQNQLKIIHVAGTSGKTSTSYYIASLLHEAGFTTGLTVSPHIDQINERVQIDLEPLPEKEYCEELAEFLDLVEKSELSPSYFEVLVAFAYWTFYKRRVDYAVIEVGLGGLLDGTNVVDRPDKVCVITDIGFDHVDILGDTLVKIATQKAGIIHASNEVFIHDQSREVMEVVEEVSRANHAMLHVIGPETMDETANLPTFQQRNLQLASRVVAFVLKHEGHAALTENQVNEASQVYNPVRMEIVLYLGKTIVMDGAHNEQKISALVYAMEQRFPGQTINLLVSFGQNKQASVQQSLKLLRRLSPSIILTRFAQGQDEIRIAMDPDELANYAKKTGFTSVITESEPLKALKLLQNSDTNVSLITGSLYLLENFREIVLAKN
jgi:dihydrofolate synthase/folylpolyglutamate synthase